MTAIRWFLTRAAVVCLASGCGPVDSELDAGTEFPTDGGDSRDASDAGVDAPEGDDASTDAGVDGGEAQPDAEPDGNVGPIDAGDDAAGSTADAGAPCTTPGELRTVACGMCGAGTISEICSAEHLWEPRGMCVGDDTECVPGTIETMDTSQCGRLWRSCDSMCAWRPWMVDVPDGECEPDGVRVRDEPSCTTGFGIQQRCSATCAWEDVSTECVDECGDAPRTAPHGFQEICIPAGPFLRGHPDVSGARDVATIEVSAFYIDQYPVTNDRYRACVDAGGCTSPATTTGSTSFLDLSRGLYPVQGITWSQAVGYCAWDGGRRLPTEAEYEKAARGPAPRAQRYTWLGDFDCSNLPSRGCPGFTVPAGRDNYVDLPLGSLPRARSYYGVEMMIGAAYHWIGDWFQDGYYADPASLVSDPVGPPTGTQRVVHGSSRYQGGYGAHDISARFGRTPDFPREPTTFRCVRPPD